MILEIFIHTIVVDILTQYDKESIHALGRPSS